MISLRVQVLFFSQHTEKLLVIILQESQKIIPKKSVSNVLNKNLIFNRCIFPLDARVVSWKCCSAVYEVSTKTGGTATLSVLEESMW